MRFLVSFFVLSLTPLLAGCDSSPDPVGAGERLLPLDAQYAWSIESRLVETDSLFFAEDQSVRVRTVGTDASVPGYDGLTVLEARGATGATQSWYERTDRRLRAIAYASPAEAPFALPRGRSLPPDIFSVPAVVAGRLEAQALRSSSSDSIIVRDDPRVVYELPFEIGTSWVSFTDPFGSTREVVGRERVTVAAGTFDCFVIRTEIDIIPADEEFEWLDYISLEHGLVLRMTTSTQEYRGPENEQAGRFLRTTERLERTGGR